MQRIGFPLCIFLTFSLVCCGCGESPAEKVQIDPRESELMPLIETGSFFELRDVLQTQNSELDLQQLFFLAILQNAFNQPVLSNQTIHALMEQVVLPDTSLIQLLQIQMSNHLRLGQYRQAHVVAEEIMAFPPSPEIKEQTEDVLNLSHLLEALVDLPPQQVKRSGDTTLLLEGEFHKIPVELQGRNRNYILDTGANLSVLMRSEASELGLQIREAGLQVGTSTDLKIEADVAVSDNLRIGNLEFANVVFLVFPDETLTFPEANFRIPGIVGFPVIEAMGELHFRGDGTVLIPGEIPVRPQRNLALDELDPRISVEYEEESFICRLDTGANKSEFYQPFFDKFRSSLEPLGDMNSSTSTGVGGSREFTACILPHIELVIGGAAVELENSTVYTEPVGDREHLFCNIGLDVLGQFSAYIINFRDMALIFE